MAALVSAPVLLVLSVWAALQTAPGRELLAALVEDLASAPGAELAIGTLDGALPGEIVLRDVTLSDADGVWLRLDTARLDWRPLALLAGRAEIDTLDLGTLAVPRGPQAGPASEEPTTLPEALPELPVGIVAERIAVERVELGAPLLGAPVVLAATGRLRLTAADGLDLDLAVRRSDGSDLVSLAAAYAPQTRRLDVDLDARADAGSPFARLAGLPGAPALELALRGTGEMPGWQGDWRFAAGTAATASGTATIERTAPLRLALRGEGDVAALLPEDARGLVRPALDFDLAIGLDMAADLVSLDIARLRSDAFDVAGTASLALPDQSVSADLELTAGNADALGLLPEAVSYGRLAATVRADGPLAAPRLDLAVDGSQLAFGDVALAGARLDLAVEPGAADGVSLVLAGTGLAAPPPLAGSLAPEFRLEAHGALDGPRLALDRIAGAAGALRLEGNAEGDLETGAGEALLTLAHDDLSGLSALAGLDLSGAVRADLQVARAGDGATTVYLDAVGKELGYGEPALAGMLGAAPRLSVDAALGADGAVELHAAQLAGAGLRADADAAVPAGSAALRGHLDLRIPKLATLATAAGADLAGAAELSADLGGTRQAPQLDWTLAGRDVAVAGTALGAVRLTGKTRGLPPDLQGRLDVASGSPVGDIAGGARFALAGETLQVRDFSLARGGDRIAGGWSTTLDTLLSAGRLDWRIADLAAYQAFAGDLAGRLEGDIELAAGTGAQSVTLTAGLDELRFGDAVALERGEIELRVADALGAAVLDGTATLTRTQAAGIDVAAARAAVSGDLSALRIELDAQGQAVQPITLDAAAEVAAGAATGITFERLDMTLGEQRVRLQAPAELRLAGDTLALTGLDLALAEGTLRADAELGGGRAKVSARGRAVPVRLAGAFVPDIDPRGTLDLDLELSGALPRPDGRLTLSGEGLRLAPAIIEDQAALALQLDAGIGGGRIEGDLTAVSIGDPPLSVAFDAPLRIDGPAAIAVPPSERLELSTRWQGRLKPIMALLPIDTARIEGTADLDASVSGTVANPLVRGRLAVRDGVFEYFETGTLLRPFELEIAAEGPRIEIVRFSGDDTDGGRIEGQGTVDLSGEVPRFDLRATADDARIVHTDRATAELDAELALTGTTRAARLGGDIETDRVEISIEGDLPPDVQELDVRVIDPETSKTVESPTPEEPPAPALDWLALDLRLEIPNKLFIRGRGLDSEWAGAFDIGGTAATPRIRGDVKPVRGGFDFAGKRFELAPGSIGLSGGADIDPVLDLAAVYREDDFTARVSITGHADDPQIDIGSEPALPRDEVISRVLFGKGTGELNALQGLQVAQTAARLSGGGGVGVLDMARNALGVDVLTLAPGATEEDLGTLKAGKYIADDVFVGVRQGATPGSTGAIVEWEVTPNITVESEAGGTEESSVGVRWEWDY